ncbi:LysR substrate-binding domain-containing protein [Lacibacterium aquatile]|uniref:LysR substrate-binding domain-containing protein n=1 Tax=Lacibacterium aquatile TaxID=1168082 RepID=A0ABW5DPB7_9PROT
MRTSKDLPPLIALRAFDAVARHLSFRKAAEELLIGQSAVSHHIRALEEDLGLPLFERVGRGVALTSSGAAYHQAVTNAFEGLATATRQARALASPDKLTVTTVPSFANYWLAPRLGRFLAAHPTVELSLRPGLDVVDMDSGAADIAIRYGGGNWPDGTASLLIGEQLALVSAPKFVFTHEQMRDWSFPVAVARHQADFDVYRETVRQPPIRLTNVLQVDDYTSVVSLVENGSAVTMGRLQLLSDKLAAGSLVLLANQRTAAPRNHGHWVVLPKRDPKPVALLFAKWLETEAKASLRPVRVG